MLMNRLPRRYSMNLSGLKINFTAWAQLVVGLVLGFMGLISWWVVGFVLMAQIEFTYTFD